MKLAIMQPYFFPYLGYFQLVSAVDCFVFYDDVAFIKQGWINRNRILVNEMPIYFTVPLAKASSNVPINKTLIHQGQYAIWKQKFLRTLEQQYSHAPYFDNVFDLVRKVVAWDTENIASLAIQSVKLCSNYLGISRDFKISSRDFSPAETRGVCRVLDICRMSQADVYVNAPGGKGLYDKAEFEQEKIVLTFLNPQLNAYPQNRKEFLPGLAIVDVLMNCGVDQIQSMLKQYTLE
ncbi:MAG: WbqC family protein [Aestuariibacter sp.]|nr:WbqC family protein [Aestuariibacter sp.]